MKTHEFLKALQELMRQYQIRSMYPTATGEVAVVGTDGSLYFRIAMPEAVTNIRKD